MNRPLTAAESRRMFEAIDEAETNRRFRAAVISEPEAYPDSTLADLGLLHLRRPRHAANCAAKRLAFDGDEPVPAGACDCGAAYHPSGLPIEEREQ